MSNLSDLLPAGAGGKQVDFVASGTIGNGVAVVLNSDGTVSAADGSSVSQTVGSISALSFVASGGQPDSTSVAYDPVNDKYVIFYIDTLNSNYPNAVVATVTGTTVTFGTPVVVDSNAAGQHTSSQGLVYDSDQQQFIAVWRPNASYSGGRCSIGTLSGTSTSWTSPTTFASGIWVYQLSAMYDSVSQNTVIAYLNLATNDSSMLTVTNNGSTLTVNTSYVYTSAYSQGYNPSLAYDTANNKVLSVFRSNSNYIAAIAGTISGTSISFGTPTVVYSTGTEYPCLAYDISSGVGVFGCNVTSSPYGRVGYFNISGSTITAGSTTTYNTGGESTYLSLRYDPTAEDCMLAYRDQGNSGQGTFVIITTTSSSISVGSETLFTSSPATTAHIGLGIGTTNAKALIAFQDGQYGNTNGYAVAVQKAATLPNYTDFIGISDAAISDTATGSVTIKGGIAGSVAYNSGPGAITDWTTADYTTYLQTMTYDDNAGKLVIVYPSGTNSNYGYYVVGAVSGTSLSFGTPGLVSAVSLQWPDIVYDANAQKVVVAYNNGNDSDHGYAVVGTVSGTSITWGTPVKFESGAVYYNSIVYDSSSQKVVISYIDSGNSNYGTSIVGTVSGTSISFGTAVVFESANTSFVSSVYDSTSNKIVISYRDNGNSGYGTAIVGTVSGTSISFGSPAVFESSATDVISVAYDANANKIVVAYRDTVNSNAGTAVVGTVSGTNISFGTPVVFQASGMANQLNDITAQYDPSTQTVLIGFRDTGDSNYGKTVVGTVSGTSISFTTPATFNQNTTLGIITAYDANQQKMVIAFDQQGTTPDTKAFVYTPDTTLTPNTNYYVQSDGSLSTTSSSVLAGKALSSTSINLDYTT